MLREPAGEGPGIVAWEGAGQHAGAARVGEDGRDLDVALARLIDPTASRMRGPAASAIAARRSARTVR